MVPFSKILSLAFFVGNTLSRPDNTSTGNAPPFTNKITKVKKNIKCIPVLEEVQYRGVPSGPEEKWMCELPEESSEKLTGIKIPGQIKEIEGLEEVIKGNPIHVASGQTTITMEEVNIDNHGKMMMRKRDAIDIQPGYIRGGWKGKHNNRKLATDTKTVLVLRVVADVSTSESRASLSDKVFGTNEDEVNLSTQYSSCSHGKLNFIPTPDDRVTNGVYEVDIRENADFIAAGGVVNGISNSIIRNAAIATASDELGYLPSQFDHVMVCIPPGSSGTWIAYAYINSYLSVYNDNWCKYPSAQIHEVGHNLGLAHSSEGESPYGDQSGMMGYSYSIDEGPKMCFNGAKSWQLGWYSDRQMLVNPPSSSWLDQKLLGIVDYDKAAEGEYVIAKIEAGTYDYFVAFNHVAVANSGSIEAGNRVLVTKKEGSAEYRVSSLEAKLDVGEEFVIDMDEVHGDGETVFVRVEQINLAASPAHALVSIGYFNLPTFSPAPTPVPLACTGEGLLSCFITTDKYPQETSWTLTKDGELISNGGGYSEKDTEYHVDLCIPAGNYIFTMTDSYGDGNCCIYGQGGGELYVDGNLIESFSGNFGSSHIIMFSVDIGEYQSQNPTQAPTTLHPIPVPIQNPTQAPTTLHPILVPTQEPTLSLTTETTHPPSLAPVNISPCVDDEAWFFFNSKGVKRTCAWVSEIPEKRCNKVDEIGTSANVACEQSCGGCDV